MGRKVVVTETVTAELMPSPPPPAATATSGHGGYGTHGRASGGAGVADAVTQVLGVAPGVALGEQMVALSTSLAFAAHNATSFQQNHGTTLGATTVLAVTTILGNTPAATVSRIAPARSTAAPPARPRRR